MELTHTVTRAKTESSLIVIVGIFVLITLVRLASLATSNVDLFTDEARELCKQRSWSAMQQPIGSLYRFCRLANRMFISERLG